MGVGVDADSVGRFGVIELHCCQFRKLLINNADFKIEC
jgi:hypothetical protein